MNKKSFISYLILILLVMFVPSNVGAEEKKSVGECKSNNPLACAVCEYEYTIKNGPTVIISTGAFEQLNGEIEVDQSIELKSSYALNRTIDVSYDASVESKTSYYSTDRTKLTCGTNIYVYGECHNDPGGGALNNGKQTCNVKVSYKEQANYDKVTLNGNSLNGKELKNANSSDENSSSGSGSSSNSNSSDTTCHFELDLLDSTKNYENTNKTIEFEFDVGSGSFPSSIEYGGFKYPISFKGFNISDFSNKCNPGKPVYGYCYTGSTTTFNGANSSSPTSPNCVISDTKDNYSEDVNINYVSTAGENDGDELLKNNTIVTGDEIVDCEEILGDMKDLINKVYKMIEILAPILLIVFGSIDFGGAVMQNDDAALKKATSNFIKRTIATVAVFFLPLIVRIILSLPGVETGLEDVLCGIAERDEKTEIVKPGSNKKDDGIKEEIK